MKLILTLILWLLPSLAFGAVGFGNCTTANTSAGTSLTWSHTVAATANSYLVVTYHGESDADGEVSGITYNAISLTAKQRLLSGPIGVEVYERIALGTGDGAVHNVVISSAHSNTFVGSACSFNGVDQTTPSGTAVTNTADPLSSGSVTVPASGMAYEVAIWGHNGDCVSPVAQAAGQTKQFNDCAAGGNNDLGMGSTRTATGAFTWDASNGAFTASLAIPINAFVGGTSVTRRRVVGIQ